MTDGDRVGTRDKRRPASIFALLAVMALICLLLLSSSSLHCLGLGLILQLGPPPAKQWAIGTLRGYGLEAEDALVAGAYSADENIAARALKALHPARGSRPWLDQQLTSSKGLKLRRSLQISQALGHRPKLTVLQRLASHSDPLIRMEAVRCLGQRQSKASRKLMLSLLDDPSPQVRGVLSEQFQDLPAVQQGLMTRMLTHPYAPYRLGAILYFGRRLPNETNKKARQRFITALCLRLRDGFEHGFEAQCILEGNQLFKELLDAHEANIKSGNPVWQRRSSELLLHLVYALTVKTPRMNALSDRIAALATSLLSHKDLNIRLEAAFTLAQLGRSSDNIVAILTEGLSHPNYRWNSAIALGMLGHKAEPALQALKIEARAATDEEKKTITESIQKIEADMQTGHSR